MFFVSVCVEQKIINADQYIWNVAEDSFHEPLQTGWTTQEAHRRCDPMELALAWMVKAVNFCESSSSCICQNLEVRSKVVKIVESALQMFANTFGDFLHRVCVNMGVLVELPEFLNDPVSLALFFFGTQKMGEFDLLTTPNFNHSSSVCSMNW